MSWESAGLCAAVVAAVAVSGAPAQSPQPKQDAAEVARGAPSRGPRESKAGAETDGALVATGLVDSAAASLAEVSRTCDDTSLLFGVPTAQQRERVAAAAAAALGALARAETAANEAVAGLEERLLAPGLSPEQARAAEAEIEPLLTRLVDVELAQRIPALRLEATVLGAAAARGTGETALASASRAALELVARTSASGFAAETRKRLLTIGLLLGMPAEAQRDAARRQLEWIVANAPADPAAAVGMAPADWVRVHLAAIVCGRRQVVERLPCPGRDEDWLVDLLVAEAGVSAARLDQSRFGAAMNALLAVGRRYGGGDGEIDSADDVGAVRAVVYQKVAAATSASTSWEQLDAEAMLARAVALRADPGRADGEADGLLSKLVDREDAPAAVRARAMWRLALAAEHPATRRGRLGRLITQVPRTRLALLAAQSIADQSPRALGDGICRTQWESEQARGVSIAAFELLSARDPEPVHIARLIEALVSGAAAPTGKELGSAITLWGSMRESEAARTALAPCISEATDRALSASTKPEERAEMLRTASDWFAAGGSDRARAQALKVERAELALESGLEPAVDTAAGLRTLIGSDIDAAGSPQRARLRATLGAALRAAGDPQGGAQMLRTVADAYEADARSSDPSRALARRSFWAAWAELLELVRAGVGGEEADGDDAGRTRQAQRLMERLEILDSKLGGEPWAGRIRAAAGAAVK